MTAKVHALKPFDRHDNERTTLCGKVGFTIPGWPEEFDTATNDRFEATTNWRTVTCKRCAASMTLKSSA